MAYFTRNHCPTEKRAWARGVEDVVDFSIESR